MKAIERPVSLAAALMYTGFMVTGVAREKPADVVTRLKNQNSAVYTSETGQRD